MSGRITIPAWIEAIYANSRCKNGVILHSMLDVDGVVKSPICCVIVFGQTLDILHVCLRAWPNTMPCLWAFFHSHRATFYESIDVRRSSVIHSERIFDNHSKTRGEALGRRMNQNPRERRVALGMSVETSRNVRCSMIFHLERIVAGHPIKKGLPGIGETFLYNRMLAGAAIRP
jgi:hypothetical protein